MRRFESITDIDTTTDTGRMFLAVLSILSGNDFINYEEFGATCDETYVLDSILNITNYVYTENTLVSPDIDDTIDEGKLLLTAIYILSSNECKSGHYGSHKHVDYILERIIELNIMHDRKRKIDLIV